MIDGRKTYRHEYTESMIPVQHPTVPLWRLPTGLCDCEIVALFLINFVNHRQHLRDFI